MSFWKDYAQSYIKEDENVTLADIVKEILIDEQREATNMVKPVNLWTQTNFNSFKKVNAFGNTIQFWFEREPNVEYNTTRGWIELYSEDIIILHVNIK